MDIRQRVDIILQTNHSIDAFIEAQEMSDEAGAAVAATEIAQYAHILSGNPIPLSADPLDILKAVDKISLAGQLDAMGITSPEVRRTLGLPPLGGALEGLPGTGASGSGPFGEAEIVTPIILDLDGDGVETVTVGGGAYFDHEGDGFAESTGWAGADDGLLVWDRNGDGMINNGSELFGNNTPLANGQKAANGFASLAELDSNQDGKIDSNDTVYTHST